MTLSESARRRLAAPLVSQSPVALHTHHSLPIEADTWAFYSTELVRRFRTLADTVERQPSTDATFDTLRSWVDQVAQAHSAAVSMLLALEPFQPFGHMLGVQVAAQLGAILEGAAEAVVDNRPVAPPADLRMAADAWPLHAGITRSDLLKEAFGLDESPVDSSGEFRPPNVFRAYAYHRTTDLIEKVIPHLISLGTGFTDVLAAVSVVGAITWAPDQVTAYIAMDALLMRLRGGRPEVVEPLLEHFKQRQRTARQARQALMAAWTAVPEDASEERWALAVADIYRRLAEGPVRQYGWALCCLKQDEWKPPPTLTPVRDAMVAAGGLARNIAERAVLVSVRNGSAHESLEWDGLDRLFRVESDTFDLPVVQEAARAALAFDCGCEAAMASFRAESNTPTLSPPSADDAYRMPNSERAEALFGTNNLVLVSANLNAVTARVNLAHLDHSEINPCFQALMGVHRLLPRVAAFEVRVQGKADPLVVVAAEALEHGMPVWLTALETFDSMPFSTFLPANYAARSAVEAPMRAARAVAWIAADDTLDALDGMAEEWHHDDASLFLDRLGLVELALIQCLPLLQEDTRTRPAAVLEAVTALRDAIVRDHERKWTCEAVDALPITARLRHYWSTWGPIARLPGVEESPPPGTVTERQPARRVRPPEGAWGWRTF